MASTTTNAQTGAPNFFIRFWDGLMAASQTVYETSEAAACARKAAELSQLSDAELAERGIKRHEIVSHAFRTYSGI